MLYEESSLQEWIYITEKQRVKDELLMSGLEQYFVPGNILEIGAGVGQLSEILQKNGCEVIASDLYPFFVNYMKSRGLNAVCVDALNISKSLDKKLDNVFTQGVSTIVNTDLSLVEKTYSSIYQSLKEGGRFVFIFPHAYNFIQSSRWSNLKQHREIINRVGFKVISIFRHQIMPSEYYAKLPANLVQFLESSIGKILGIRYIIILEK